MENTYNGKPLKFGYIPNLHSMTRERLNFIHDDMGLRISQYAFAVFAKNFRKPDGFVSLDEIYLMDSFIYSLLEKHSSKIIANFSSSNEKLASAFQDLMEKRRALEDRTPVTLASLISIYNRYLSEAGYDDGKDTISFVPKSNLLSTADSMKKNSSEKFSTADIFPYAIAKADKSFTFGNDKKRIANSTPNDSELTLILVDVPNFSLAYELLADTIEKIPHLAPAIRYASPVGKDGLLSALDGLGCGFMIDMAAVTSMLPAVDRPFMLTEPMSAAVVLANKSNTPFICEKLSAAGFTARAVGNSLRIPVVNYVNYNGYMHKFNKEIIDMITITGEVGELRATKEIPTSARRHISDTVSILSFTESDEAVISAELKNEIGRIKEAHPQMRLAACLTLPENELALTRFLAVYPALAEDAIPIRRAVYTDKNDEMFHLSLVVFEP